MVQQSERLQWIRPVNLQQLLAVKVACGSSARLVCGSTEVTLEMRQKHRWPSTLISISAVTELCVIHLSEGSEYGLEARKGVVIGGAVTLDAIERYFKKILVATEHEHRVIVVSRRGIWPSGTHRTVLQTYCSRDLEICRLS